MACFNRHLVIGFCYGSCFAENLWIRPNVWFSGFCVVTMGCPVIFEFTLIIHLRGGFRAEVGCWEFLEDGNTFSVFRVTFQLCIIAMAFHNSVLAWPWFERNKSPFALHLLLHTVHIFFKDHCFQLLVL